MVEGAFDVDDEEKKKIISYHFSEIMKTMGLDLEDDSLKGSPDRVAKMYIDEIFSGLNPKKTNPRSRCLKISINTTSLFWKKTYLFILTVNIILSQ
jgi:GTP cyclohydrolase I